MTYRSDIDRYRVSFVLIDDEGRERKAERILPTTAERLNENLKAMKLEWLWIPKCWRTEPARKGYWWDKI
jgi:hypothetical protein